MVKKIFYLFFLGLALITPRIYPERFNPDYASQTYNFLGPFAFHSTNDDLYYSINTIPNLDLAPNKLLNLKQLIGERWRNVTLNNGTKLILSPQLAASKNNWTTEDAKTLLSVVPYVVIDRENDFINIYIYSTQRYGTKLVFDILAFESFMRKTSWYQHATKDSSYFWDIGFEFYAEEADFQGPPNAQNFLMNSGIKVLDVELAFKNETTGVAQFLAARIENTDKIDPKKWNANLLFDNNIAYIKDMSTNDVTTVEKILTDAGISLK